MIHCENKRIFSTLSLDKKTFRKNLILTLKLLPIKYFLYYIYFHMYIKYLFIYIILYSLRNRGREEGRKQASKKGGSEGGSGTVNVTQKRLGFLFKPLTSLSLVRPSEMNFNKTSVFFWF